MSEESEQPNQLVAQNSGSLSFSSHLSREDDEMSKSFLTTFKAKEEEIEKKKMEVRDRVQLHLGRVEQESKRLSLIREVISYPFFTFLSYPLFPMLCLLFIIHSYT